MTGTANDNGTTKRAPTATPRALLVLGFLVVAAGASGCFVDSGSSAPVVNCDNERVVLFDWQIVNNINDAPLTCDQAAASSIVLNLGSMKADFACPIGVGSGREQSPPVAPGTYPTYLELIGVNGQVLSDTSVVGGARNVTVPSCAPVSLGVVTFGT